MDRTTYADASVCAVVNGAFVPVRVDADRRPDIGERYSLGGWPTTAFLTPDGDVLGGGTYFTLDRMPAILDRVADAYTSHRTELTAPTRTPAAAERGCESDSDLMRCVFAEFDDRHGGFGGAPKFPITAPLELAIEVFRENHDETMAHLVEVTLDAMGWRGLHDDVDGGFFRCAATADWQDPRQEKTLEVNACVLRTLVEAADVLRIARYQERASDVIRYVQTWLADPVDGGWSGSQEGDSRYYSATAEARRQMVAPHVDPVLYTAWNGQMVSAMLRAAELLDDSGLGEFAVKSLERLTFTCYAPGAGIAHCLDQAPSVRGLLDDQVAMGSASLDVYTATGNVVYLMMAQELAHYAVRVMWDEQDGGFFDRSIPDADEAIGLMRERRKPFVANCDAARLLRRLSATKGDHDFGNRATATLAAMAPQAPFQGPLAAHYLLAARQGPLT
jgi:uncharacterized protein YyaL (SSP411 family)